MRVTTSVADISNLLMEYGRLKKLSKSVESQLTEVKEQLLSVDKEKWSISGKGSQYLWDKEENYGVQLVVPEPKSVLDREKGLAYVKARKLRAITEVLDDERFGELVEEGKIPLEDVQEMMSLTTPSKPYLKEIKKVPAAEEE